MLTVRQAAAAAARKRLQAVLDKLNPAGGKTISAEDEAAAKDRAKKKAQRQKQGQKQGQRKAKTGPQPQPR
jgi:Skp family chaperone for outer membrane proteins